MAIETKAKPQKPVKEKKTKAIMLKKPKSAKVSSHPPYFQMIKEALLVLKERSGSSPHAIAKYIEEKHKAVLPANFKKIMALQLKNCAVKGKLIKIKASYKLSESEKKEKVAKREPEKKPKQAKVVVPAKAKIVKKKSETTPKRKAVKPVKKVSAKKMKKTVMAKPKQPKSIKSPAAKRARKSRV